MTVDAHIGGQRTHQWRNQIVGIDLSGLVSGLHEGRGRLTAEHRHLLRHVANQIGDLGDGILRHQRKTLLGALFGQA